MGLVPIPVPEAMPREHEEELNAVETRMAPEQWETMRSAIRRWANETGRGPNDYFASNWQTGRDWAVYEDGVFQPLYVVCDEDYEHAAHMFGWLVRSVMIKLARTEDWMIYKNQEAGTPECPRPFWGTFYRRGDRG